jgi:EmrB/QacA subfamily drug resistance transporter
VDRRAWTLIAVVLGSGIVFLDSTIVNVALEKIGEQLPATLVGVLEGQSYVVNGYLLTLSALLVLAGGLADAYGRRRLFVIGLTGFGAASVLCALAPTMELLIAGRVLQGACGALLVPTSLAIISATYPSPERGRAFGLWAAATSVITLVGPPLGGLLVDTIGWQAAFLLNIPLVALAVAIAATRMSESRLADSPERFDWLGAAVVALAVGGLSFGAIRGQQARWEDPAAWAALAVGAVACLALAPLMLWRSDPLVHPHLFRSRNFTVTNLSTFLVYGALYVFSYYLAIFLQGTFLYTALAAGLAGLPVALALSLLSTTFGRLADRLGPRRFMAAGPALMAVGLLWLVRVPASSAPWPARAGDPASLLPPVSFLVDVLPAVCVFGLGLAVMVAPLTAALMTSVPDRNAGIASAVNNALSRIGPLLAGAVIFIAVSASFYAGMEARVPGFDASSPSVREAVSPLNPPRGGGVAVEIAAREASTDAFHLAMLIAALLCAAGAAVNALGIRDPASAGEIGP